MSYVSFTIATGFATYAIIQYFVLDGYERLVSGAAASKTLLSLASSDTAGAAISFTDSTFKYDPYRDHVLNKCWLAAFGGYWSIGITATLMDLFPSVTLQWKIQGERSLFTAAEWAAAAGVSMFNLLLMAPLFTWPLWRFWNDEGSFFYRREETDAFVIHHEALRFLGCVIVVDFWFYWTHRALHWPKFYATIHKFHHRFTAPTAVASMYANPLEFGIGNLGGVILGPFLTRAHPYTFYFWTAFSLISTGGSHSGYFFFAAQSHDWHHEHFNYNFGVGGAMDAICRTQFVGSKLWEKKEAKRQYATAAATSTTEKKDA